MFECKIVGSIIDFQFDNHGIFCMTEDNVGSFLQNQKFNTSQKSLIIRFKKEDDISQMFYAKMLKGKENRVLQEKEFLGNSILINEFGKIVCNNKTIGTYGYKENTFFYALDFFDSCCKFYYTNNLFLIQPVYATLLRKIIAQFFIFRHTYPIHASCISKDGNGILFLAKSGGGKTTTAVCMAEQYNYQILNDEMIFWQDGKLFALPWPIKTHRDLKEKFNLKVWNNDSGFDKEVLIDREGKIKYTMQCQPQFIFYLNRLEEPCHINIKRIAKYQVLKFLLQADLNWYYDKHLEDSYLALLKLAGAMSFEITYYLKDLFELSSVIYDKIQSSE